MWENEAAREEDVPGKSLTTVLCVQEKRRPSGGEENEELLQ
jgi:hypothetical protein